MKNKRFLVTLIAIFALLITVAGFTACGKKTEVKDDDSKKPPIVDDIGGNGGNGGNGGENGGGEGSSSGETKKNFTPSIEVSLSAKDIYYYDEDEGSYKLIGKENIYYFAENVDIDWASGGKNMPSFKCTLTVTVIVKNSADSSDKGQTFQTKSDVNLSYANYVEAEIKNGKFVFTFDLMSDEFKTAVGRDFCQAIISAVEAKTEECGLSEDEKRRIDNEISNSIFSNRYVTAKNLQVTVDNFIYLSEPLDGGVVSLDLDVLDRDFSAYEKARLDYFALSYDKLKNLSLPSEFKNALQKEGEIYFYGSDLLNRSSSDIPEEEWEDRRDEFKDENEWLDEAYSTTYLDRDIVKFKKTIGYQSFTIEFKVGDYFGKKYSEKSLSVGYEMPSAKFTFEKETADKKVKLLYQVSETDTLTATVTAKYDSKKGGYTVQAKDLPVFFASKITTNEYFFYYTDGGSGNTILLDYETPNSVSIDFSELDVNEYLSDGLGGAVLKYVYDGGEAYKVSFKDLKELADDETLPYAETALMSLEEIWATSPKNINQLIQRDGDKFLIPYLKGKEASFNDYFSFDCKIATPKQYSSTWGLSAPNYAEFTAKIKIIPCLDEVVVSDSSLLSSEYWEGDDLEITYGATISLKWNKIISAAAEKEVEEVTLTASLIDGFTTDKAGSYTYVVKYDGKVYKQDFGYVVKPNAVVSLEVKEGSFTDTYVTYEDLTVTDSKLLVSYENGNEKEVDIDVSMVSGFNKEKAGKQTLTISFGGQETTHDINVREVSSLSMYEGLSRKYCINQKPQELVLKVTFKDGDSDDYDYIIVSGEKIQDIFDTSSGGGKTFSYIFGGKEFSYYYVVYEAVYLYYTENENLVTIDKMNFDTPEDGVKAYKLTDCVNVEIPETIDGLAVTEIAQGAFSEQSGIESLILPSTITAIGNYAFSDCVSLKSINIPYGATLGTAILENCKKLEDLTIAGDGENAQILVAYFNKNVDESKKYSIPENLTVRFTEGTDDLIDGVFKCLSNQVQKVVFPSTQTTLGVQNEITSVKSFESSSSTVKVVDGALFTESGANLYYYPETLTNKTLVLGEEVTSIGIINNNPYLEEVTINGNLNSLSEGAFSYCEALTKVVFNGSLEVIPDNAFSFSESLTTFKFPSNLKTIGYHAFAYVGIETVRLPDTLTSIDTQAFYAAQVKRLYIPSSATASLKGTMGYSSYYYLEELVYDGSIPLKYLTVYRNGDSYKPSKLTKIYLTETICEGFANGTNYSQVVYLSSKITTIPNGVNASYTKLTVYYEGSTITNNSDKSYVTATHVSTSAYTHWW